MHSSSPWPTQSRGDNTRVQVTSNVSRHTDRGGRALRPAGGLHRRAAGGLSAWLHEAGDRRCDRGWDPPSPVILHSGRSDAVGKPPSENDTSYPRDSRGEEVVHQGRPQNSGRLRPESGDTRELALADRVQLRPVDIASGPARGGAAGRRSGRRRRAHRPSPRRRDRTGGAAHVRRQGIGRLRQSERLGSDADANVHVRTRGIGVGRTGLEHGAASGGAQRADSSGQQPFVWSAVISVMSHVSPSNVAWDLTGYFRR